MKPRQGGFLVAKVHQAAGRIFSRIMKEHGLESINPAQGRILFVLWQQDAIPIQQLAARTSLSKSTLTSMLDRLEVAGLVRRAAAPADRRQAIIQLTGRSERMKRVYADVSREMSSVFYRGFAPARIDRFENDLGRILQNLREAERG